MNPDDSLFHELATGLCHCTSLKGYRDIISDGFIRPNEGAFPYSFPQSQNSCCRKLDSVSLFDFETAPTEQIFDSLVHANWSPFVFAHRPVTVVLKIRRGAVGDRLIDSNEANRRTGGGVVIWPVEACYPDPIPVEAIQGAIVTYPLGTRKYRAFDGHLPSVSEVEALNIEFRTPIITGAEQHTNHTFNECVFVTRLDHHPDDARITLVLAAHPDDESGMQMTFEGVNDLNVLQQMSLPAEYVELIDQVDHHRPPPNMRTGGDQDYPVYRGEMVCKIATDIRKLRFRADSQSIDVV